jgi:hypothetical protein
MSDAATGPTHDPADAATDRPRGGIDVFDSLLVRQPVRPGETGAVRDLIAEWAREHSDGDARTLLPVAGVNLVTLFLDRGGFGVGGPGGDAGSGEDALVWYVEVADDDDGPWTDPGAAVRGSPLFAAGLEGLLEDSGTVYADGRDGCRLVTHATNPHRSERYVEAVGPPLVAPVAGEELPVPVVAVSVPLRPGLRSRVVARLVDVGNWLKRFDRVHAWLRDQTDTLEAEAMYTESLLLEPVGNRLVLHYYMEAEDMDRLYEAYEASDNWEVRFSDWAMRRVFEDPGEVLTPPLESDCEVLVHAVDPDRP